jgi:pyrroline-5-carboxylate reductase
MKTSSFGFIGGGRITRILLQAFKNKNVNLSDTVVFDTNEMVLASLKSKFPEITTITDDVTIAANKQLIFIALHPPVLMETLARIKDSLSKDKMVISLAPKITLEKMEVALNGFKNIARMNPSASAIVNQGVNPIAFSSSMKEEDKTGMLNALQPLGFIPEVKEEKIEAYAVISAMGHTYFFFQLQKLKELALSFGMDENETQRAITGMVQGSAETLFKSGLSFNEVADLVPVRPLAEVEGTINGFYEQYLTAIYNKIKPS